MLDKSNIKDNLCNLIILMQIYQRINSGSTLYLIIKLLVIELLITHKIPRIQMKIQLQLTLINNVVRTLFVHIGLDFHIRKELFRKSQSITINNCWAGTLYIYFKWMQNISARISITVLLKSRLISRFHHTHTQWMYWTWFFVLISSEFPGW